MENIDILIFAGQSNMQGETEGLPEINEPVNDAFEYRLISDSLIPLKHPVGEDLGENSLLAAHKGCGNLVPFFCDEYVKTTGKKVVAVHTARGSTTISQWLCGMELFLGMVEKVVSAIKKTEENYKIDKIYLIWLQGESDAIDGTSSANYEKMITDFKNSVKQEIKIDKFGIIQVGYFCRVAGWLEFSKNGEGILRDEEIMNAQYNAVQNDKDFIMLTDICKTLSMDSEYMNPYVGGHYNNKGMSLLGKTAGKQLAMYEKGELDYE